MSGNVWEWCFDLVGTSSRRIRGGGWNGNADFATVAYRGGIIIPDGRGDFIGFRLVRSSGK